jgi:hypothetical protein
LQSDAAFGRHGSAGAFLEAQQLPLPTEPLSESAAQLCEQIGDVVGRLRQAPVALELADIGGDGERTRAGRTGRTNGATTALSVLRRDA